MMVCGTHNIWCRWWLRQPLCFSPALSSISWPLRRLSGTPRRPLPSHVSPAVLLQRLQPRDSLPARYLVSSSPGCPAAVYYNSINNKALSHFMPVCLACRVQSVNKFTPRAKQSGRSHATLRVSPSHSRTHCLKRATLQNGSRIHEHARTHVRTVVSGARDVDSGSSISITVEAGLHRLQRFSPGLPVVYPYEGGPPVTVADDRKQNIPQKRGRALFPEGVHVLILGSETLPEQLNTDNIYNEWAAGGDAGLW